MKYNVKTIHGKEQIETCTPFAINHYMWDSTRKPKAYGWMGYLKGEGLFVKMVCEETNPKRVYQNPQDPVYEDSAMEIFLAFPEEGEALSNECMYTNFEINSNGAMLANYGAGRKHRYPVSAEQYRLTGVKAEREEEKWYLEVLFPESYLNEICDFDSVKKGRSFYCNFYKIAEDDAIRHYGSFSPIESETPNFHLPVCFAEAQIERD